MKRCFLIAPLGSPNSEIRKRTDILWNHVVVPTCENTNYSPLRSDFQISTGNITQEIVKLLFEVDLVIADISNVNPNVMYELGVRHVVNKPTIVMASEGQNIPFDIASYRTIFYKLDTQKNIDTAAYALQHTINQIEKKKEFASPVSDVVKTKDIKELKDSDFGPILRSISERVGSIEESIKNLSQELPRNPNEIEYTSVMSS